jgi:hypothetical protein
MPAIIPAILAVFLGLVGIGIWLLCLPTQCPPWRERRIRHYHGKQSYRAASSRPAASTRAARSSRLASKRSVENGLFEAQALHALIANRGRWYCPSCWGAASGLAPTSNDLIALDQIARSSIEQSKEYERTVVNGARQTPSSCVCSQIGQPDCVFDRDGSKRPGWDKQDWLVRARPL